MVPFISLPPQDNVVTNLFLPNKGGEFVNVINLKRSGDVHLIYTTDVNLMSSDNVYMGINLCNVAISNVCYEASINRYVLPNEQVKSTGMSIYSFLTAKNITNVVVVPLSEGGIGFEFYYNSTYYNLKVDNELDAVFYKEEPNRTPQGWDLSFNSLLNKIKLEFNVV